MHFAARTGNVALTRALLNSPNVNVNETGENGSQVPTLPIQIFICLVSFFFHLFAFFFFSFILLGLFGFIIFIKMSLKNNSGTPGKSNPTKLFIIFDSLMKTYPLMSVMSKLLELIS